MIDVILNLEAGQLGHGHALYGTIVAAAHRGRARVHATRSLDDLEGVAREITARGTDGVVLAGGDGSYMAGLSALARACRGGPLPRVALAPGGTVCTIPRNLGMRGGRRAWAERVVRASCDGTFRIKLTPTLRVRDDAGVDRVGFIFGTGLVARFFEIYDAASKPGLATAAQLTARIFAGSFFGSDLSRRVLQPEPCALSVDGATHPARQWSLVLASAVRNVGLHFIATYRAGEELERFHVVASGLPPRALAAQVPRALVGSPIQGEPRVDTLARSLSLNFDAAEGAYVLDGDLLRAGSVEIAAGPVLSLMVA